MGRLRFNRLQLLGATLPAEVLIQTGTGPHSDGLADCAPHFKTLHSIELDRGRHTRAARILASLKNVILHLGDSCRVLPRLFEPKRKTLFFLDAHCPPDATAAQCPLMAELDIIFAATWKWPPDIIIDDSRMFQDWFWKRGGKSRHYDRRQWPRMKEIIFAAGRFGYGTAVADGAVILKKVQ